MKYLFITCITVLYFIIGSCKNGGIDNTSIDLLEENNRLKQQLSDEQLFISILNDEIGSINTMLDSIGIIHNYQSDYDTISIDDKIMRMDSFLIISENKIKELETTVYKLKDDKQVNLLNSIIKNLKKEIVNNNLLIEKLRIENDSIKNLNLLLSENLLQSKEENSNLTKSVNDQIAKYETFRKMAEEERKNFSDQKNKFANELNAVKSKIDEEKANAYFNLAIDLKEQFDDTGNGFLGSKKSLKNDILLKSYTYFREACKFGHSDATRFIKEYLTNEKYYKNLKITITNKSAIGKCGI